MKESPLFSKTYDLLLWFNNHTRHYPKHERFRLAKRMDDLVFLMYEQVVKASMENNKTQSLFEAALAVKKLTVLCRLSKDAGNMTDRQYFFVTEKIVEIAKMINAWRKKVEQQA